ncbi:hypothetical protein QBC44DRAFT_149810 [Cladorrhinum sp. PSN332]|nr:hypothetical protein QBC44DRAFT_149810 [Cladorrhinum sp. PSN332]
MIEFGLLHRACDVHDSRPDMLFAEEGLGDHHLGLAEGKGGPQQRRPEGFPSLGPSESIDKQRGTRQVPMAETCLVMTVAGTPAQKRSNWAMSTLISAGGYSILPTCGVQGLNRLDGGVKDAVALRCAVIGVCRVPTLDGGMKRGMGVSWYFASYSRFAAMSGQNRFHLAQEEVAGNAAQAPPTLAPPHPPPTTALPKASKLADAVHYTRYVCDEEDIFLFVRCIVDQDRCCLVCFKQGMMGTRSRPRWFLMRF